MLKGFLTVSGWTMASRLLGFARDMLIAALLGAGPVADAFVVAIRLPNLFRRLFGEGAFNAAFVPVFSAMLHREGVAEARRFAEQAMAVLAFWLLLLTILGEIFMPEVISVLALGFSSHPHKFALTVTLSRITFPYLPLICLTALLSGVLNGIDRFAAAAAAPVLFNLASITAMLFLTPYVATAGHAAAWGVSLSGVPQLALLYWAVKRGGLALRPSWPRVSPEIRLLFRRMLPGLIGAGVTQLNLAIDTVVASLLPPGSVAYMYYADRVNQLPLGVLGTAIGVTMLPLLSRQVSKGDSAAAIGTLNRAIEQGLLLTLPAALALAVIGDPIMQVLFCRGAFTAADATFSAQSLAAYALGLPAFVLVKVLAPGFFARGDTATPVRIGMFILALNLALNLVLMVPLRHVGPPLATTLAAMVNVGCLGAVLARRGYFVPDRMLAGRVLRMLAASLAMTAVLLLTERRLLPHVVATRGMMRLLALCLLVGIGITSWAAAAQALGLLDLRRLPGRLRSRMRPRTIG